MFTNLRYPVPAHSGDWKHDGPVWAKAISDYWLSLEKPGALNIGFPGMPNVGVINVEDYIKPSDTDDTKGIQAAAAALVAQGGGVLWFKPGASYTVFTGLSSQTFVINVSGCTGVVIMGNGCTVTSGQAANGANQDYNFIYASPATGLHVSDFKFVGSNTGTSANSGEKFLRFGAGCKRISVIGCRIYNCAAGLDCDDYTAKNRGVTVLDCYFEKCFYPLEVMCTDDVFARYTSIAGGRCYFPVAQNGIGCNNHDISVTSSSAYTSSDCLLRVYAVSGGAENALRNIRINYHSPGRQAGAGDGTGALIHLAPIQFDGSTAAALYDNIHVNVMVEGKNASGSAADYQPFILLSDKTKSDGTGDGTARGHKFQNITLSGVANNWDDALGGVRMFDDTTYTTAQNWSGDIAMSLAIRDFVINGNPVNDCIWINGQPAVTTKPFLTIDNVSVADGTYTEANCSTANIAHRAFKASNLDALNYRTATTTPTPTSGSGTFTSVSSVVKTMKDGDRVFYDVAVSITTNGTAATSVKVALPSTPSTAAGGGGWESAAGKALTCLANTDGILYIRLYDSTYPGADGVSLRVTGHYDI